MRRNVESSVEVLEWKEHIEKYVEVWGEVAVLHGKSGEMVSCVFCCGLIGALHLASLALITFDVCALSS